MNNVQPPVLWTKDFILVFVSNLLLFFSFYLLIPVLPFYLMGELGTSGSLAGIVLSLYTISALLIRPFSGFMVDMFSRKPLYLICYGCFCAVFAGYVVASTLLLFIVLRVLHGFSFGVSTVSGSTVAVDLMTPARRGEGIGYYGMAANIAMAVGPVAGLWLYEHYSFDLLFLAAFASGAVGFVCITLIRPIRKEHPASETRQSLSLDRFILLKALPCVALLFIAGIGYGAVLNYVGLYSETAAFGSSAGIFFTLISIGIVLARVLSAKAINGGQIIRMAYVGGGFLVLSFLLFVICSHAFMLYTIAFLLGMGFGYLNPAFQSMFINLAEHNQRGTANATYFTFWDFGIGTGTAIGGWVIEKLGFEWLYALCAGLLVLGILYFAKVSASCYRKTQTAFH
jgi:predicted MFS family arabinose efflux permease